MKESESSQWKGQNQKEPKKSKEYECECGKKYQSPTALNTHVKAYHGGVAPNTSKTTTKPSRGRPKQYQFKQLESKVNTETDPLLELRQIQDQTVSSDLKGKQIYQNQPVYKLIQRFMEEDGEALKFIEEDKIYEVTMGKGLSILIKELRSKIEKEQFLNELILLITIYISYVIEQTEDQNVLSNGSVGLLPQFANIFILFDLSKRCERLKISDSWINNSQTTISVLNIIFRWLIYKQFTHTMALVNKQFNGGSSEQIGSLPLQNGQNDS